MRVPRVSATFVMAGLALGLMLAVVLANWTEIVEGQSSTTATGIAFDFSGVDVQGNPESIQGGEVGIFSIGGQNPQLSSVPVTTVIAGVNPVDMSPMLQFVANGSYDFRARVRDLAGNWSAWSQPATIEVTDNRLVMPPPPPPPPTPDTTPPAPPTNVRTVQIVVSGDGSVTVVVGP